MVGLAATVTVYVVELECGPCIAFWLWMWMGRLVVLGADMAALLENLGWRVSVVVPVAWAPSVNSSKTTMAIAQAPCPTT